MVEASTKLAQFVGLDAYRAAGGSTRADLFGEEVYLEKPAVLNRLAEKKLANIRHELEAEGWRWIEINPERDWTLVNRCNRLQPSLIEAPPELIDFKRQLDAEIEEIERLLEYAESEELIEKQQAVQSRLDEAEEKLAAFVGFDAEHKSLAGCFVSIGQDGTPFIDKGLVRPEQRTQLAKLLNPDGIDDEPIKAKPKNAFQESLRRDLAAERLQVAQVEIARHPAIALDLLVFQVANELLGKRRVTDGPDVKFNRSRTKAGTEKEPSIAACALVDIEHGLATDWLNAKSEAERFDSFRSLPEASKLELLAYVVALTLKPKLAPGEGDESTAYDVALSLTGSCVAGYWRPTTSNFLGRISRNQLLAISRDVLGELWAQSSFDEKKAILVDQLDRAFSNPEKSGRTPDQIEKLKSWLPQGMSFDVDSTPKPAHSGKGQAA